MSDFGWVAAEKINSPSLSCTRITSPRRARDLKLENSRKNVRTLVGISQHVRQILFCQTWGNLRQSPPQETAPSTHSRAPARLQTFPLSDFQPFLPTPTCLSVHPRNGLIVGALLANPAPFAANRHPSSVRRARFVIEHWTLFIRPRRPPAPAHRPASASLGPPTFGHSTKCAFRAASTSVLQPFRPSHAPMSSFGGDTSITPRPE